MGTTSTLRLLAERWQERGIRATYVDLRMLAPTDSWVDAITLALVPELDVDRSVIRPQLFQYVNDVVQPFVPVIDEFDLVAGPQAHAVLSWLLMGLPLQLAVANRKRGVQSQTTLPGLIVGSRQSLFDIERATDCIDSPWFHQFQAARLSPLVRTDARQLVSQPSEEAGKSLATDAEWLVEFAGTWPFYLKLACHHAFERKSDGRALAKHDRSEVEEQIWGEARPYLQEYWTSLNSQQRNLLANIRTWSRSELRFDPDIARLLGDGICIVRGSRVVPLCELFATFFRQAAATERMRGHALPTVDAALHAIVASLNRLGACIGEITVWDDSTEERIQEAVYMILRAQYERVVREVHVTRGPEREYRCDIVVEDLDIFVEVKRVRSREHGSRLQAELNDDIVGYRVGNAVRRLVFVIWDRERHISDREYFCSAYERADPYIRIVFAP